MRKRPRWHAALLLSGALALLVCQAEAQTQPKPKQPALDNSASQTTLTGDWGGLRSKLQQAGISFNAHYASESAGIVSGSLRHAARYTQQLDLETLFDLQRLASVPDAKVQFTLTDRKGRSLTNDVLHNQFSVQELYGAGQNFRLAELNYQQGFDDRKIQIELGWSPIGDDFARLPDFCEFQNGVICGHANAMTTNSGAHNFPTAEWGARIRYNATPVFYLQTGVYQVNPDEGNADKGFDLSFRSTGRFIPLELGWQTGADTLPGTYKVGAYYNSSTTPDVYQDINGMPAGLTSAPFIQHNGRWGAYGIASQTVYRANDGSSRSLRLGIMGGMGDRATAQFNYFWITGGVLQAPFAARPQDFIAFMLAYAHTNPRLTEYQRERDSIVPGAVGIQKYEGVAELDYGVQVEPWLKLRPNLQYIVHPGGTGAIPDTLVLGLYVQATF